MALEESEVQRRSIRFSPNSNTELNVERLPGEKALEGMELCFRETPSSLHVVEQSPVFSLLIFSILGCAFSFGLRELPEVIQWLWIQVHQTEGMPVVGGMLASMVGICGLLLLVFIPKDVRRGLAMLTLPSVALVFAELTGWKVEGNAVAVLTAALLAVEWESSCFRFHLSWLHADPRMTKKLATTWKKSLRRRWVHPTIEDAASFVRRFLVYDLYQPAAPGIWRPSSSRSSRVLLPALFAGVVFALAPNILDVSFSLPLCLSVGIISSMLALFGVVAWVSGTAAALTGDSEVLFQNDQRSPFERVSDRLRDSEHVALDPITKAPVKEAEHLFLGFEPYQHFPVLLHEVMLGEHVYIAGRTGSGKTSKGLMQLLIQLLRGHRAVKTSLSEKRPMVIIDLKGDETLFQTAKAEAEARGQKFRFFTLEPGRASFHFNPFLGFKSATLTVPQMVQLCLDSLDLYHGTGYGRGYYSQRSRFLLSQALRNPQGINSFQDLYQRLKTLYAQNPDDFRDAFELLSVVESLTFYDQLVTTVAQEAGNDTIRLDRVLEDREVVYFWLPSVKESVTVAQLGKLVLFNLRTAAHERQVAGKEKREVFLMIDEFQKLAGENFQQIIQQARSAGIATILANQSLADLKTPDWDLTPTIRTNTRTKMYFSITEPDEIQVFRDLSGEEIQTFGLNEVEEIRLRFSTKELASLSDHPNRLLLQVSSGSGYTQFGGLPIPVETDWPISKTLSDERAAMPWPTSPVVVKAVPPAKPQKVVVITAGTATSPPTKPAQKTQAAPIPPPTLKAAPAPKPVQNVTSPPAVLPSIPKVQPRPAQQPAPSVIPPKVVPQVVPVVAPAAPAAPTLATPISTPVAASIGSMPQPPKGKKRKKNAQVPKVAKPAPPPAVKQAFAQKIQSLMQE